MVKWNNMFYLAWHNITDGNALSYPLISDPNLDTKEKCEPIFQIKLTR